LLYAKDVVFDEASFEHASEVQEMLADNLRIKSPLFESTMFLCSVMLIISQMYCQEKNNIALELTII